MSKTAAVITVSDKGFQGQREDTSGPALCGLLQESGWEILRRDLVPDEAGEIQAALKACADELGAALVLTTGGTGFSPRDVTPEATLAVVERLTPGIPEAMRAESMKLTPRGCLSRSVAGIRGRTLIVNLPGSEKAACENLLAVLPALGHGVDMLRSAGSADCAAPAAKSAPGSMDHSGLEPMGGTAPSLDAWLRQAKADENAGKCGMYLFHNGVVRQTARAQVRFGQEARPVTGMELRCDGARASRAIAAAYQLPGVGYIRVWLNQGRLNVGDDIMLVLIGGDTRPHVVQALEQLVHTLKNDCIAEQEHYAPEKMAHSN